MLRPAHIAFTAVASLILAACADPAAMVAGGAKASCKGSGSPPCTRPAPGNMDTTPPK